MADPDQPVMLTYRCPDWHVAAVRRLLEAHRVAGVRFEEQPRPWWARLFGRGTTFSIRCPSVLVEHLHRHLADRAPLRQAHDY